jgi:hypothetical protein
MSLNVTRIRRPNRRQAARRLISVSMLRLPARQQAAGDSGAGRVSVRHAIAAAGVAVGRLAGRRRAP